MMMQQPPTGGGGAVHPSMHQPPPQQHNDGSSPMMMMMAPYLKNQLPPPPPPPAWNQQPPPPPQVPQQYSASPQPQPQPQPTTTSAEKEEEEFRTLWIGNLEHWMHESYIRLCFNHTGEVFTTMVIRNPKTDKSECYGFVEFQTHAIAERILHTFNGKPMPMIVVGGNLRLKWAPFASLEKHRPYFTVYVEDHEEEDSLVPKKGGVAKFVFPNWNGPRPTGRGQCGVNCEFCAPVLFPKEHRSKGWSHTHSDGTLVDGTEPVRVTLSTGKETVVGAPKFPKDMAEQESQTVDVVFAQRVHEIAAFFEMHNKVLPNPDVTPAKFEDLLDELKGFVGSIDIASTLHSIGGLVPLFENLCKNIHAGIRAKVAEVVTTMVHNNPRGQQLVMEVDGLQHLFYNFIADPDATAKANAFDAISSLIRNNKPGITAFRRNNGYVELRDRLLSSVSVDFQRKALNLIQYLLHENSSDCSIVTELGFPSIMMHLAFNSDAEVREAALVCLLVNSGQLVKNDDKVEQALLVHRIFLAVRLETLADLTASIKERELADSLWDACLSESSPLREKGLLVLPGDAPVSDEDVVASSLKRGLADSLWNACFSMSFPLREKGLLVFPGEDAPVSDVASKLFEPPLRAWAAADRNSVGEKIETDQLVKR